MTFIDLESIIKSRLSEFDSAPFLFVGSGLSRRYLGLPNWEGLLKSISSLAGVSYNKHHSAVDGNYPRIASSLADVLHDQWWGDKFTDSRLEFEGIVRKKDDVIKVETVKIINERREIDNNYLQEIALLKQVTIDGIITTNYDSLLEDIFGEEMHPFVGQKSMLTSPLHKIGEIYKIHGSVTDPTSLVLTEKDYSDFESQNFYLSSILTQIFMEHPIVFLGYSISDNNVQKILSNIVKCLDSNLVDRLSNKLIFIEWNPDSKFVPEIVSAHINFRDPDFILPITKITINDFSPIYRGLKNFKRKIPLKILRLFQETAYRIVIKESPESKILLADLEGANKDQLEFVFGHGVISHFGTKGIFGIERPDIFRHHIGVETTYKSSDIFEALHKNIKGNALVPIGRYFFESGRLSNSGNGIEISIPDNFTEAQKIVINGYIDRKFNDNRGYSSSTVENFRRNYSSIESITKDFDIADTIKIILCLEENSVDVDALGNYLCLNYEIAVNQGGTFINHLVCFYDHIKYISPLK